MTEMACVNCHYFRVPDDGKIWGASGVCDNERASVAVLQPSISLADMPDDGPVWRLPCGALVVKEWNFCFAFIEKDGGGDDGCCWHHVETVASHSIGGRRGKIIYQDFENGDDANDGSCPEQAVLTPRRALELTGMATSETLTFTLGEGGE